MSDTISWDKATGRKVKSKFERDTEPRVEELRTIAREAPRFRRTELEPQRTEPESVTVETKVDLEETDTRTT